jgi:hypothetical protein
MLTKLAGAQSVTNVRFEKSGKQVLIFYDLSGDKGSTWNISVYCSRDGGKTMGSPLQKISGDCGKTIAIGTNKKITWDVLAEYDKLEGAISFKVEATKGKDLAKENVKAEASPIDKTLPAAEFSANYYKYKKIKTIWMASALVTGGIGVFTYLQTGTTYSQYQSATTDADALHSKADLYNKIAPISLGIAAFCAVEFILVSGKQKKARSEKLTFYPQPILGGGGLGLAYTF